jgi:DNA-binding protein YbaB
MASPRLPTVLVMGEAAGHTDLGALAREAVAARERWSAVEAAVAAVRVERSSPGAEVGVAVDGQGRLVDVRFGDRTRVTAPERLAELLLAAVRAAQGALVDEVAAAVGAAGAGSPETTRALLDAYRRRFPPPEAVTAPPEPDRTASWLR